MNREEQLIYGRINNIKKDIKPLNLKEHYILNGEDKGALNKIELYWRDIALNKKDSLNILPASREEVILYNKIHGITHDIKPINLKEQLLLDISNTPVEPEVPTAPTKYNLLEGVNVTWGTNLSSNGVVRVDVNERGVTDYIDIIGGKPLIAYVKKGETQYTAQYNNALYEGDTCTRAFNPFPTFMIMTSDNESKFRLALRDVMNGKLVLTQDTNLLNEDYIIQGHYYASVIGSKAALIKNTSFNCTPMFSGFSEDNNLGIRARITGTGSTATITVRLSKFDKWNKFIIGNTGFTLRRDWTEIKTSGDEKMFAISWNDINFLSNNIKLELEVYEK